MTLNDLCAIFKVIDSLNAAKMAKYSSVMTPTQCRVAGSVRRTYSMIVMHTCTYLLTYLLTYTIARGYKAGNTSKTVEDRAKAIINGLYKVVR